MKNFNKVLSVLITGAFVWAIVPVSAVFAGELDSRMEKMVKRMVKTVHERSPELDNATMAVFPFNTDEKLAKKKVDVAVSELLTQQLLKNSKFKLVERAQLEKIMAEQKLGQSGAIDSETAAKVGKLLGARLAMLGSVSRFGKSYQISAKIVDIDTAEILSAEIEEISVSVFDEEASRYLALVPETQAIGIYVSFFSNGTLQNIAASPVKMDTVTLLPQNPEQGGYDINTLGVKYYFYKDRWLADVNFAPMGVQFSNDLPAYDLEYNTGIGIGNGGSTSVKGAMVKGVLLHRIKILGRLSGFLGGGFATTTFEAKKTENVSIIEETNPAKSAESLLQLETVEMKEQSYTTPIIRAGVEFRPQARFGIGMFGSYYVQKFENAILRHVSEPIAGGKFKQSIVEIYKFTMPQTYFEFTATVYF